MAAQEETEDVESAPLLTPETRSTPESIESTAFGDAADTPKPPVGTSTTETAAAPKTPTWRILLGIAYMCAMGVCGIVLTAIGSTLDSLAANCGTTALHLSTVFLARGAGAMAGSFGAGKLYSWFHGNYVLVIALLWVSTVLMLLSWCTQIWYLHVLFCMLGLGTAIVDTGCQIMSRKAHGRNAGPWLGANTVLFGIAGAIVPLMEIWTTSLIVQFSILATCGLLTAIAVILIPVPTYLGQSMDKKLGKTVRVASGSSYWVEACFGCAVFCLIGGKVAFSSYLKDYIADTLCIEGDHKSLALAMLWVAITFGRLFGLKDQIGIESKGQLYSHLYAWLVFGALGVLIMLSIPRSNVAAWFGIIMYGFGNGPCVGYCYDINNRITVPSEFGMAVVMFGLNFGASIIPYLTALAWSRTHQAFFLPLITFLTMVLPIAFVRLTKHFQKEEIGFMYAIGPAAAAQKQKDATT